jgi:hypothetical protein
VGDFGETYTTQEIDEKIARGLAQIEHGETVDGDAGFLQLLSDSAERRRSGKFPDFTSASIKGSNSGVSGTSIHLDSAARAKLPEYDVPVQRARSAQTLSRPRSSVRKGKG